MRRAVAALALLAGALGPAACSSTTHATAIVHLRDVGGPSPSHVFPHGGHVVAQRNGHGAVTLAVPRSGTGSFKLPPGDYTFVVRVPPAGLCESRGRVTSGHPADVTVTCGVD